VEDSSKEADLHAAARFQQVCGIIRNAQLHELSTVYFKKSPVEEWVF